MFGRQISLDIQEFNVRVFDGSLWWQAANGVIGFEVSRVDTRNLASNR